MRLQTVKNCLPIIFLLSITGFEPGLSISIKLPDIFDSAGNIISGVGSELGNIIPTGKELLSVSKNVLFGYPEVAVMKVLNEICSVYMASDKIEPRITPNANDMYFQIRTPCKNISIPLLEAEKILENPDFAVNKKVVLFVTGWMSDLNSDYIQDMAKAFHCRGGYNFLALNTSDFIQTLYTWSAFNTEAVGQYLGEAIAKLAVGVPLENIHLVGHSLGAQILGFAGRHFTLLTNETLPRITGLDPANPCFNEGESLSGLYRGDAKFVDIIHSNPGVLGKRQPVGDIDFFPEGLTPIKPGCYILGCSHSRAYEYFIETVFPGNEKNFLAKRCNSLAHLNDGYCIGSDVPMGFAAPTNLKGDFFLSVNAKAPFGKSATKNAIVEPNQCGKCTSA